MMKHRRRYAGFFMTEVIVALAIVTFVLALFTVAISRQAKGSQRLNDSRTATLLAEQTIAALQSGSSIPTAPANATVKVTPLETPSAAKGQKWASVDVKVNGRSASLVGMVPANAKLQSGEK
jgi:type II secretory pathway pseudopilin PulG